MSYSEIKEAKMVDHPNPPDCCIIRPSCTSSCCRNYVGRAAKFLLQWDFLSSVYDSPQEINPKPKPGDLMITIASFGHQMYGINVNMFDHEKRWKVIHVEDCLPSKWCCCGSSETFDSNNTLPMTGAIERAQSIILTKPK